MSEQSYSSAVDFFDREDPHLGDGGHIDQKFATTVAVNGRSWAIGAQWSEPRFGRKPSNAYDLARDEGHDPDATLASYFPTEAQIAWYVFPDRPNRPARTPVLAQVLIRQLSRRADDPKIKFPLTLIFNLGSCYWLIIFDANRNVLPGYDRWGSREEIFDLFDHPDYAGTLATFSENPLEFAAEDKALAWLFEDWDRRVVYAEPLSTGSKYLKTGLILGIPLMIAGAAGHFVLSGIEARQDAAAAAQQKAFQEQMLAQQRQITVAQQLADTQFNDRLRSYWSNYPLPWAQGAPPGAIFAVCQSLIQAQLPVVDGWNRIIATCTNEGADIGLTSVWKRGTLATVFEMPTGAVFDTTGNIATTRNIAPIATGRGTDGVQSAPPNNTSKGLSLAGDLFRDWLGTGQQYQDVMVLQAGQFVSFMPPVPPFVPQNKVQEVQAETPVLWKSEDIKITSAFAPWDGWPILDNSAFVVESISALYTDAGTTWTMIGEQYGR
jgi:hypothetical protein